MIDAHLEPLSSPRKLWVFHNPRPRQLRAIFNLAASNAFGKPEELAGIVLGGDFNTIQGGTAEPAYALARAWSENLAAEDPDRHISWAGSTTCSSRATTPGNSPHAESRNASARITIQ